MTAIAIPAFAPVLSCAEFGIDDGEPLLDVEVALAGTFEAGALLLATFECEIVTCPTSLPAVELGTTLLAICVTVCNNCGAGALTTKLLGS